MNTSDTLFIRAGTYAESLSSSGGTTFPSGSSWNAPATIAGYPGETVILRPVNSVGSTSGLLDINNASFLIFDNLTVDATQWAVNGGNNCVSIEANAHHIRLQNSTLKNAQATTGDTSTKGVLITPSSTGGANEFLHLTVQNNAGYGLFIINGNNLISDSTIHDNNRFGIFLYSDPGGAPHDTIVRNNRVYNNGGNSAACLYGCFHSGMYIASGANNTAYNNVVYNNADGGIVFDLGCTGCTAYYNTIVGNQGKAYAHCIEVTGGSAVTAQDNICWQNVLGDTINNASSSLSQDHNLLGVNPQFVNQGAADFHLQSGSPAVRAGIAVTGIATDLDGNRRPTSMPTDIGAYQFTSGNTPPPTATLTANPTSITAGNSSTLTWNSTNATSCTGSGFSTAGN